MLTISPRAAKVLLVVSALLFGAALFEGNVVSTTEAVVALLLSGQLYAGTAR